MSSEEKVAIENIGKKHRTKEQINADMEIVNKTTETTLDELGLADLEGIGPITVKKLQSIGINKVEDLLLRSPVDLVELTGKTRDAIDKLMKTAMDFVQKNNVLKKTTMTGRESLNYEDTEVQKLTTGCNSLNKFFNGGMKTRAITEIYGGFGAGKTQLCLQEAIYAQLPVEAGGLDGRVIWIDTENTFKAKRMVEIIVQREIVPVKPYKKSDIDKGGLKEAIDIEQAYKFLDGVEHIKPLNSFFQGLAMDELGEKLKMTYPDGRKVRLVIVDSLIGLFRLDYIGRANLSDRQGHISAMIGKLDKLKKMHNVVFLVTNQVMMNANAGAFMDPTTVVGGTTLAHASDYRVYLQKAGKTRIAKFVDSPEHAYQEAKYQLSASGVVDEEEK